MALMIRGQILFLIKTLYYIPFSLLLEVFVHFILFITLQSWFGQCKNFGNSVTWLAGCLSSLNWNYKWNLPRSRALSLNIIYFSFLFFCNCISTDLQLKCTFSWLILFAYHLISLFILLIILNMYHVIFKRKTKMF